MSFDPPRDPVNIHGQLSAAALRRVAEQAALSGNTLSAGAAGYRDLHGALTVPPPPPDPDRVLRLQGAAPSSEGYLPASRVTWDPVLAAWADDPPGDLVWLNLYQAVSGAPGAGANKDLAAGDLFEGTPDGSRPADGLPLYLARGVFGGAGDGHSSGLVPDPGPAPGMARFLREDAQWRVPLAAVGGPITGGTTTTIDSSATWNITGADLTSAVSVTSLTWVFGGTSVLTFAGPAWNITANTTATISAGVALAFVGGSISTSVVSLSSLTWSYGSTSVLVFAGPAWHVTQSTTCAISASTSLAFVGLSVSMSAVNIASLTWSYDSTSALVFADVAWGITQSTTLTIGTGQVWQITGGAVGYSDIAVGYGTGVTVGITASTAWTLGTGVTWAIAGGTFNISSAFVFGGPSFTFGLGVNTVLLCGDLVFDVCDDPDPGHPDPVMQLNVPLVPQAGVQIRGPDPVPVVIDPNAVLDLTGGPGPGDPGQISLTDLMLQMNTGLEWGITDDVTTTISPGKAWSVAGGSGSKIDFTGVTVEGAGGVGLDHLTGSTGDAYAVLASLGPGGGVHGSFAVKNTGAINSCELRMTVTTMFGTASSTGSGAILPGNLHSAIVDELLSQATPVRELLIEIRSTSPGSPTNYEAYISTTD